MKLIRNLGTRLLNGRWYRYGLFLCVVNNHEVEKRLDNGLKARSCGSLECIENKRNSKHGEIKTRLYHIWHCMKQRCLYIKAINYKDYGGRGIIICPEWTNDYIAFRDWALNNGYTEGLQINRMNNDGNYEPSNCNFITAKENARQRRGQKIKNIEMANEIRALHASKKYTQKELANKYTVSHQTISEIINNKKWENKKCFPN